MQKLEGKTFDVVQDNIEKLQEIFPEVFTENKVDIDKLRIALGEHVETEKERYEFTWNGKTEAIQLAQKQTTGTLRPCKNESVNWETTQNLYLEGDNLEVLRVLQNSYRNKVKLIYIDPPYNTGKDFVYKDNFHNNIGNYKANMNENMKSNPETNGRFHSAWLNMMYPRLKLARQFLQEDGVLFVSIDDNEVHNLRHIINEIFGEENFIANVVWHKKYTRSNDAKWFSDNHDHILVVAKNKEKSVFNLLPRSEEQLSAYSNPDNHPKGRWKSTPLHAKSGTDGSFTYTFKNGVKWSPPAGTYARYSIDSLKKMEENNEIWFGANGTSTPSRKSFLSEVKDGVTPITLWSYQEFGHNHEASNDIKELFPENPFNNPKPVRLIQKIIELATDKNDIVMDFFSGSGTTAQAVLEKNYADEGNRKFILIQIPEPTPIKSAAYKAGYKNICEIGKERIRRAAKKIVKENKTKKNLDVGFKVFKLDETNLKIWEEESRNLEKDLLDLVEPIKEGRTQEDVAYEILLRYGINLTVPIEEKVIAGTRVFSVGMGYLLICLEQDLTIDQIDEIAKQEPARIVFYDEGFKDDTVRTNAQQILKRYGLEDIRVI